jgi:hypothetical protein
MDAGVFTKKIGPLPVWGWMGIGTAGLLALGSAGKGKNKQSSPDATPQGAQPPNNTQGPANSLGQFAGGVFGGSSGGDGRTPRSQGGGGNQWTNGSNGQYGHTGFPSFGNGWTRPHGHLQGSPPMHGIRGMKHHGAPPGGPHKGHSGGFGGHNAGPGHHGIGGGSRGIGGIHSPHGKPPGQQGPNPRGPAGKLGGAPPKGGTAKGNPPRTGPVSGKPTAPIGGKR